MLRHTRRLAPVVFSVDLWLVVSLVESNKLHCVPCWSEHKYQSGEVIMIAGGNHPATRTGTPISRDREWPLHDIEFDRQTLRKVYHTSSVHVHFASHGESTPTKKIKAQAEVGHILTLCFVASMVTRSIHKRSNYSGSRSHRTQKVHRWQPQDSFA